MAKPDLAPMKPLDVLFVQSQYDTATPAEGASAFFAELPKARRVYVSGDFTHGIFATHANNACVNSHVTDYLLGESPTERDTVCQAAPLKLDALSPDLGRVCKPSSQVAENSLLSTTDGQCLLSDDRAL